MQNTVLINETAWFTGLHLLIKLTQVRYKVTGVDNFNDYREIIRKASWPSLLTKEKNFKFFYIGLVNRRSINGPFTKSNLTCIVNRVVQASPQNSDVNETYADVENLICEVDFKYCTAIKLGIERFIYWHLN